MAQIVDYIDIRDSFVNLLKDANTTTATYDLSTSLTSVVRTIGTQNLEVTPLMQPEYPLISVRLESKEEEFTSFGSGKLNSEVALRCNVFCVWDELDAENAEVNLWKLVRNIETNIRLSPDLNNYKSGGTEMMSMIPATVDLSTFFGEKSPFNVSARIGVSMNLLVT